MEPVTTTISGAIVKRAIGAAASRFGDALGPPFESELQSILRGIRDLKAWLEADRLALLSDGFSFILQDDLDAARRSLTQARSREPRSSVVRFWLALVLSWQGRSGGINEMRDALGLNPFVVPPPLLPFFALESDLPTPPGSHWTKPLNGTSPGMTYGALGSGVTLHPSRWAISKIAGKIAPQSERAIFSDSHAFKGKYSSILTVSMGAGHPVVHWMSQPFGYGPTFLSMFDAATGQPRWHQLIPSIVILRLVTPSLIALQDERKRTYTMLSTVSGQPVTANIPENYFRTLFHPEFASSSELFKAAHASSEYRDLSIPKPKIVSRYRKNLPPDEHLAVRDPFGQRLAVEATNHWIRITGYYREVYCTSGIALTSRLSGGRV